MNVAPAACNSAPAHAPSSGVAARVPLRSVDSAPSMIAPVQASTRGPTIRPAYTSRRTCWISSNGRFVPISRMPVSHSRPSVEALNTYRPSFSAWVCMSHKPGIRNLPLPSTRRVSLGNFMEAAVPTSAIRSPATRTVISRRTSPLITSTTLTSTNASGVVPPLREQQQRSSQQSDREDEVLHPDSSLVRLSST